VEKGKSNTLGLKEELNIKPEFNFTFPIRNAKNLNQWPVKLLCQFWQLMLLNMSKYKTTVATMEFVHKTHK